MKIYTYEKQRLKKEFDNIVKLSAVPEMEKILSIKYDDRITRKLLPINNSPAPSKYPEIYYVQYTMPMYISKNNLNKDWQGSFKIILSKKVFDTQSIPPHQFTYEYKPFNQHVSETWSNGICSGAIWDLAKHNGIWYFLIALGSILNLEPDWLDKTNGHLNTEAHNFWVNVRKRKPTNDIQWPYSLTFPAPSTDKLIKKPVFGDHVENENHITNKVINDEPLNYQVKFGGLNPSKKYQIKFK